MRGEDTGENDSGHFSLESVQEICESILAAGDHSSAEQFLLAALDDESLEVRKQASWGLGKLAQMKHRMSSMVVPLIKALDDIDEEVQENAAWALGELAGGGIGSKDSLDALMALLSASDAQTRGMAAWALGRMAERAGLCNPQVIEALEPLLKDPSDYVVKGAEWALPRVRSCLGEQ